jgi:hypothetical protein
MAQAVSRRLLTAGARFRSRVGHVGFVVDKVAPGQLFLPSTLVFPCRYHSTGIPLHVASAAGPFAAKKKYIYPKFATRTNIHYLYIRHKFVLYSVRETYTYALFSLN